MVALIRISAKETAPANAASRPVMVPAASTAGLVSTIDKPFRPAPTPSGPPGQAVPTQLAASPPTHRGRPAARPPTAGRRTTGSRPRPGRGDGAHRMGPTRREELRAPARRRSPWLTGRGRSPGIPAWPGPARVARGEQPAGDASHRVSPHNDLARRAARHVVAEDNELRALYQAVACKSMNVSALLGKSRACPARLR